MCRYTLYIKQNDLLADLGGFDMTTISCHRATPLKQLGRVCSTADLIVSAAGTVTTNCCGSGDFWPVGSGSGTFLLMYGTFLSGSGTFLSRSGTFLKFISSEVGSAENFSDPHFWYIYVPYCLPYDYIDLLVLYMMTAMLQERWLVMYVQ